MPWVTKKNEIFQRIKNQDGVSKFADFDTPSCFCPDGEGVVRMVPDGRNLRVRVTGVDFGQ